MLGKGCGMKGLRRTDFEPVQAKKKRYAEFVSVVVYTAVLVPCPTLETSARRTLDSGGRSSAINVCLTGLLTPFNGPSAVKSWLSFGPAGLSRLCATAKLSILREVDDCAAPASSSVKIQNQSTARQGIDYFFLGRVRAERARVYSGSVLRFTQL